MCCFNHLLCEGRIQKRAYVPENYIILITCGSYLMLLLYKREVDDLISEYLNRGQESSDFGHRIN